MNNNSGIQKVVIAGGISGSQIGSAGLGYCVAREILMTTKGMQVRVLTREDHANSPHAQELRNLGADIQQVNFENEGSFKQHLNGFHAVLCFLSGDGLGQPQRNLAKCSKECGVKLFVPSEYGIQTKNIKEQDSPLYEKNRTRQYLQEQGIPHVIILAGVFSDHARMILGVKNNAVTLTGNGDERISWTSLDDIARFVCYSLRDRKMNELQNKTIAIEGDRHSMNDLVSMYNKRHSTNLNVSKERPEDTRQRFERDGDRIAYVRYELARGNGDVGKGENLSNDTWKHWNPTRVENFV